MLWPCCNKGVGHLKRQNCWEPLNLHPLGFVESVFLIWSLQAEGAKLLSYIYYISYQYYKMYFKCEHLDTWTIIYTLNILITLQWYMTITQITYAFSVAIRSPTSNRTLNPYKFASGIQKRHSLVCPNPLKPPSMCNRFKRLNTCLIQLQHLCATLA